MIDNIIEVYNYTMGIGTVSEPSFLLYKDVLKNEYKSDNMILKDGMEEDAYGKGVHDQQTGTGLQNIIQRTGARANSDTGWSDFHL